MTNKIVKTANNAEEILKADYEVFCPQCNEKQWSPFDKLFTKTYDLCVDCCEAESLEEKSENIFTLINAK